MTAPFIGFATAAVALGGTNIQYTTFPSTDPTYSYGTPFGGQYAVTLNKTGLYEVHAAVTATVSGTGNSYIFLYSAGPNLMTIDQNNYVGTGSFTPTSVKTYIIQGQYYFLAGMTFGVQLATTSSYTLVAGRGTYLMIKLIAGATT